MASHMLPVSQGLDARSNDRDGVMIIAGDDSNDPEKRTNWGVCKNSSTRVALAPPPLAWVGSGELVPVWARASESNSK